MKAADLFAAAGLLERQVAGSGAKAAKPLVLPVKAGELEVSGVTADSRRAGHGTIFVAVVGQLVDGHDYLADAAARGCRLMVVQDGYKPAGGSAGELGSGTKLLLAKSGNRKKTANNKLVSKPNSKQSLGKAEGVGRAGKKGSDPAPLLVPVADTREALGRLAAALHGNPAREMVMIGITGTNGKTTSAYLLEALINGSGGVSGVIGTVNYRYREQVLPAPHTTPEPEALQGLLRQMREAGVTHVIMEVSSHALEQRRVAGIMFDVALFTNLSREHLDYHGDMASYYASKKKLFTRHLKPGGAAVICAASLVTVQQHPDTGPSGDQARLKYTGYEAPGCGPCQSSANSRQSAALLNGYAPLDQQAGGFGERLAGMATEADREVPPGDWNRRLAAELQGLAGAVAAGSAEFNGAGKTPALRLWRCGFADGELQLQGWQSGLAGLTAELAGVAGHWQLRSGLAGHFNLLNLLGVAGVGLALGLQPEGIAGALAVAAPPPGRLERFSGRRGVTVFVDYAHTPDALTQVLKALRPHARRLVVVFGCGGDRDRGKRPEMGKVAGRLADIVVLTSDNPRSESPAAILAAIERGVQAAGLRRRRLESLLAESGSGSGQRSGPGRGYDLLESRRRAIADTIFFARPGDVIAVCGKGHETSQIIGQSRRFFDDRQEVARQLAVDGRWLI